MASNALDRPTDGPSLDRLCGLLADQRRRGVLHYFLRRTDDTATVETLADHLAGAVSDDRDAPARTDRRERAITTELAHVHLPKLDAADVVEYAPDSETVEYEGDETAEALLDAMPEDDSPET